MELGGWYSGLSASKTNAPIQTIARALRFSGGGIFKLFSFQTIMTLIRSAILQLQ